MLLILVSQKRGILFKCSELKTLFNCVKASHSSVIDKDSRFLGITGGKPRNPPCPVYKTEVTTGGHKRINVKNYWEFSGQHLGSILLRQPGCQQSLLHRCVMEGDPQNLQRGLGTSLCPDDAAQHVSASHQGHLCGFFMFTVLFYKAPTLFVSKFSW